MENFKGNFGNNLVYNFLGKFRGQFGDNFLGQFRRQFQGQFGVQFQGEFRGRFLQTIAQNMGLKNQSKNI